ncbi:hypothetical protein C0991_001243 [Blastosporella zonata]|nr:hypothetical protein C0991_001243 [Blastosporella zonata]
MVMMERVQSTGSFESIKPAYSRPIKKSKSHDDLHRAVFPDGMVATDSGTGDIGTKSRSPSEVLRHRISSLRPNSARLGLPASPKPSEQLPPLSRLGGRLSSAFDSLATSDFIDDEITSSSRPIPGLGRSVTLMKGPTRSAELSRTTIWPSPDIVSPPRRRDSLVSQRIRAYNNGSKDEMKALMETLSEFPAPPIPRVTPESLNDHKHAYPRNN